MSKHTNPMELTIQMKLVGTKILASLLFEGIGIGTVLFCTVHLYVPKLSTITPCFYLNSFHSIPTVIVMGGELI